MSLYIGIDGGGTTTRCAVGDDVSVFAVGAGAGCNFVRLGEAQARVGLHEAIAKACRAADVSPLRVQSACIGAAGAAHEEINAAVKRVAQQILPNAHVTVVGDMVIALEAALPDQPGVIALSGTGSIAYGRNRGETARAGGWGFRISDQGSGHWIGRSGIAAVMRAHDTARETTLFDRIAREWSVASRDELVVKANANPAPDFAALFPVVQQAAAAHDEVAEEIMRRAGSELARLTLAVLKRLWNPGDAVRVAVGGGVFVNSSQVRTAFYSALHSEWPKTAVTFKISEPVVGALWMARRMGMR
jgi:glucosamine kinase